MPGLLIIAHAPLASALQAVAAHVYPEQAASLAALDVSNDIAPEHVEAQAAALITQLGTPEVLILTDVFGATPCNVAQRLADNVRVKAVTGVSVPMLWRALCYRGEPLDSLVALALKGAAQGVMRVNPMRPQFQASNPLDPDAKNQNNDPQ